MRPFPFLLVAILCGAGAAFAQDTNGERDSLLALLNEQTALATKTRLNADYVPGILSVLHGRDLELRGVRTVWEALALVPGMERAMEPNGRRKLLVRGVGNIWGSGNVKLLLNSVPMNTAERGIGEPLFSIPVAQVDRIEVVRGPGSAVHGEFAYLGVVNIITHSETPRLFGFAGANAAVGGGAVASWRDGAARFSASISGWSTDGPKVRTGPDQIHALGFPSESHAPGYSNEARESGTGVLSLGYRGFSLLLQWNEDALGDHFGINYYLPPEDKNIVERNRHRTVEARHQHALSSSVTADIFLGWQDASVLVDRVYVAPGALFNDPGNPADPNNPSGSQILHKTHYLEQRLYAGTDLTWQPHAQHTVLLGLQYSDIEVKKSDSRLNMLGNFAVTDEFITWDIGVKQGSGRRIASMSLQDEYRITDALTVTAGARYDDYSDTGARLSPRLAGVWRIGDRHIIKGQYAEAFRPQTLYELAAEEYSSFGPIEPATVRTHELAYIYKGVRWDNRITGFYSRLDDLIAFTETNTDLGYANLDAEAWGIEWEYRYDVSARLSIDGNVTFLEARENRTDRYLPGAPHWLANAGATYRYPVYVAWGLQWRYVGEQAREAADPRDRGRSYSTVDLTATLDVPNVAGLSWSVGVKNAFDSDVRYPSPFPGMHSYPDDYPRAGREWWTRISYDF